MEAHGRARRALAAAGVVLAAGLGGCASLSPDTAAAADVAETFHAAVAAGDGQAACDALAPQVVEEVEEVTGAPCAEGVLTTDLPEATSTTATHADGRLAQVVMDGDVVFLTASGDRWLVIGAGCTPRPDRPYDCTVSKG